MIYPRRFIYWIALAMLGPALVARAAADDAIHVSGDVTQPIDDTSVQLQSDFAAEIHDISYTSKGETHTARCVALLSILKKAGVQTELKMDPSTDPKVKNYPLRLIILVSGRDGYTVAFSLAELMAGVGNKPVWLALDADGQPLSAADGPARLIVPEPARWVHSVATIQVLDPSTRPSGG